MMKAYNRKTKELEDISQYGSRKLEKIYKSKLLTRICTSVFLHKFYALYNNSSLSKKKIDKFIKSNSIDMNLFEKKDYKSFNDFFIKKYKKYNIEKNGFISPCDSKLLVYKISKDLEVNIKGLNYTLDELFDNEDLDQYKNGYLFVYRLSMDNYHRYHYIDDGKLIKEKSIKGRLHTVSDYSNKYKIYKENERSYSILETKNYGNIIYMEVGAILVGKIVNHHKKTFKRGEEKGYFLPGASTIIVVANNVKVDKDILTYSKKGIETIVSVGEKVGE